MERHPDVLVVGAGPVGMCTALALARCGFEPIVVDDGSRPASHSYGVALHAASLDLLAPLGVLPALLPRGQRVDGMFLFERGEERGWMTLAGPAQHPFVLAVPQAALEEELAAALARAGVRVLWNHRLASLRLGPGRPEVTLERLGREGSGYGYAVNVWVVDRSWKLAPRFVIGADGHHSLVRRSLGIELEPLAPAVRYLAAEVSLPDVPAQRDLRILLADGRADAVWPLPGGGFRCSLELPATADDEPRAKERGPWSPCPTREGPLAELVSARVPWLGGAAVGWSGTARFQPSLATSYGHGQVWLAGDAAHVATPLGVHSLNMGLREAVALAMAVASALTGGNGEPFAAYEADFRSEWRFMLGAVPLGAVDPWLQVNGPRLLGALPASGEALTHLLRRLGVEVPAMAPPRSAAVAVG